MAAIVMLVGFASGCSKIRQARFESAVYEGDREAVQEYLRGGDVDVNAANKDGNVLDLAIFDPPMLKLLLAHGADPRRPDKSSSTTLHLATGLEKLDAVEILLQAGADPLARDSDGETPIDVARQRGYADVLARLEAAAKR